MKSYIVIVFAYFWSLITNAQTQDLCQNQQCELYPNAICLTSTPSSNNTIFMNGNGHLIHKDDCDCNKNNKLDNERCLETEETPSIEPYYIDIDVSFDVERAICYQNQRDVLFSDIHQCIDDFVLDITSMNEASHPYITHYSYSIPNDNDFIDNQDTEAMFGHFQFNFRINDVDNSTFIYDANTDQYQEAVDAFTECALLLSENVDSEGFKSITNAKINTKLKKNGDTIGTAHFFAFSSVCFAVYLMMKKSLYLPVARFWCNIFACCHHWHCCYCYNPCTHSTGDCGLSCCGFGCGCFDGCCPGCTTTVCCWQCSC